MTRKVQDDFPSAFRRASSIDLKSGIPAGSWRIEYSSFMIRSASSAKKKKWKTKKKPINPDK